MPQLDMLVFASQSTFLLLFTLGYTFFVKNIIPFISFELKMKELLEIKYLKWLDTNVHSTIKNEKHLLVAIQLINTIYNMLIRFSQNKYIIYGYTYSFDLILLRNRHRSKNEDRKY